MANRPEAEVAVEAPPKLRTGHERNGRPVGKFDPEIQCFHCRCGRKAVREEVCCEEHIHLCSNCFKEPRLVGTGYCQACDPLNGHEDALFDLWSAVLSKATHFEKEVWGDTLGSALFGELLSRARKRGTRL